MRFSTSIKKRLHDFADSLKHPTGCRDLLKWKRLHKVEITLLDLPDELLEQIVDESCPGDIESLISCCKRLYIAGGKFYEQHLSDKAKFSRRTLNWPRERSSKESFGIEELIDRPRSMLYVNKLAIMNRPRLSQPSSPFTHESLLAAHNPAWQDLFAVSRYTHIPQKEAKSRQATAKGADVLVVACILLHSLPNLRELWFDHSSNSHLVSDTIKNMLQANYTVNEISQRNGALSKLYSAHIVNGSGRSNAADDLSGSIALVPSMRLLHMNFPAGKFGYWPEELGMSNVERIEIDSGEILWSNFTRLFSHFHSLKVFRYNSSGSLRFDDTWMVMRFLELYAKQSLTDLSLNCSSFNISEEDKEIGMEIGMDPDYMEAFKHLARIEVHYEMLVMLQNHRLGLRRLIDLLPPSIEEVCLIMEGKPYMSMDLFDGLKEHKRLRVPKLKLVKFQVTRRPLFGLSLRHETRVCREAGILLEVDKAWTRLETGTN